MSADNAAARSFFLGKLLGYSKEGNIRLVPPGKLLHLYKEIKESPPPSSEVKWWDFKTRWLSSKEKSVKEDPEAPEDIAQILPLFIIHSILILLWEPMLLLTIKEVHTNHLWRLFVTIFELS